MPGAIMLASIFFVTIIEMVFSPAQHVCGGNEGVAAVSRTIDKNNNAEPKARNEIRRTYSDASLRVRELGILRGRVGSISRTLSRYREDGQRLDAIESAKASPVEATKGGQDNYALEEDPEVNQHNHVLTPEQEHKKAIMQVFLLEMGILFHSIFIGMSLAVAVGNDFTVLLIAIIFHRMLSSTDPILFPKLTSFLETFEGLALGVRIADIKWKTRALQPWMMALAYGCT